MSRNSSSRPSLTICRVFLQIVGCEPGSITYCKHGIFLDRTLSLDSAKLHYMSGSHPVTGRDSSGMTAFSRLSTGKFNLKSLFLEFSLNGLSMITLDDDDPIRYGSPRTALGLDILGNLFQIVKGWIEPIDCGNRLAFAAFLLTPDTNDAIRFHIALRLWLLALARTGLCGLATTGTDPAGFG